VAAAAPDHITDSLAAIGDLIASGQPVRVAGAR
jgi:hypothetical protein